MANYGNCECGKYAVAINYCHLIFFRFVSIYYGDLRKRYPKKLPETTSPPKKMKRSNVLVALDFTFKRKVKSNGTVDPLLMF